MARLKDLKPSISELPQAEALSLVQVVRDHRRSPPPKPAIEKTAKKAQAKTVAKTEKLVGTMTEEQLLLLLTTLDESEEE